MNTNSLYDVSLFKVFMAPEATSIVGKTLQSGMIAQGPEVEKFENELKKFFNWSYIVSVNSATSGLTLAYKLFNLQNNDEVLSTPLTCMATNTPIIANNLRIKWSDVDDTTCNIDLEDVKKKITQTTKALTFVHWGGNPVDLDEVQKLKDYTREKFSQELCVIEDCAHAFGSKYKDEYLGTAGAKRGNICVFSLQAIKHLTTGDGGLIFLPNKEMYDRAILLRWFGIDREKRSGGDFRMELDVKECGFKYHMNDINASIGLSNLPHVSNIINAHKANNLFYRNQLKDVKGVELLEEKYESSCWIFTMKIVDKPGFIEFMKNKKIMVSSVHNRNDVHSCFSQFKTSLPKLDKLEKEMICIPVGWWVLSFDRYKIVDCIKEWCQYKQGTMINLSLNMDINKWVNCGISITKLNQDEYLNLLFQMNNHRISLDKNSFIDKYTDIKNNGGYIIVAKQDNKIIGTAKLLIEKKFGENVGHIEDVVVDQNFRRKGIGKLLIEQLVSYGKNNNCYKIVLTSKEKNREFYTSCNFTEVGNEYIYRV